MKKIIAPVLFLVITVIFISFTGCSSSKKTTSGPNAGNSSASYTAYAGTWAFIVKGTPDGDTKGDMVLSLNGNVLKGMISTGGAQPEIQDLKIENNVLSGIFYYNGMAINMMGTFTGNTYEGKVEAQGYAFPMTATK